MEVTLMYLEGCPGRQRAEANVHAALEALGRPGVVVRLQLIATIEQAERAGFIGSPTILVDGRDPFAEPARPAAMSCRLYVTEHETTNAPSVSQLIRALG